MPKVKDLEGKRFGRLTVVEYLGIDNHRAAWRCKCDCGNEKITYTTYLTTGVVSSCGCYQKERQREANTSHGGTYDRLYRTYHHMLGRCNNPNDNMYEWYGGRGISVCDEWKNSYEAFRDWAFANGYDNTLSIDRINVDGNYEPGNVRWIPLHENVIEMHRAKRRRTGKTLPAGIYKAEAGGYRAHAFNVYLGTYDTVDEAVKMREIAAVI